MPVPVSIYNSGSNALISGSFWGWGKPQPLSNGKFNLQLVPGTYEFKFNVDGHWVTSEDYPTVRTFLGEDVRNNVLTVEGNQEESIQQASAAPVQASAPLAQGSAVDEEEDMWEQFVSVKQVQSSQAAPPASPQIDPAEVEKLKNEIQDLAKINQELTHKLKSSANKADNPAEVDQLKNDIQSLVAVNQQLQQTVVESQTQAQQAHAEAQQAQAQAQQAHAEAQQAKAQAQEAEEQVQVKVQSQVQSQAPSQQPQQDLAELAELKKEIQNMATVNQQLQQSLQVSQENAELAQKQANDAAIALSQMQAFQQPPPASSGIDPVFVQQQEQNIAYLTQELQTYQQELQFMKEQLSQADTDKNMIAVLNQQVQSISAERDSATTKLSEFKDIYAQTAFGLSPDEVNKYRAAFDLFDKNKDGRITKEEIAAAITECGLKPTSGWVQDLIKEADEDASGTIEWPEFLHAMTRHVTGQPSQPTSPPASKPQNVPSPATKGQPQGPRSPTKGGGPGSPQKHGKEPKNKTPAFLQKK